MGGIRQNLVRRMRSAVVLKCQKMLQSVVLTIVLIYPRCWSPHRQLIFRLSKRHNKLYNYAEDV